MESSKELTAMAMTWQQNRLREPRQKHAHWLWLIECGSLLGFLVWMFAMPAWGAEAKSAATAAPAAMQKSTDAPKPIAITDVIPRSVLALNRLREIRGKVEADNGVSVVEGGLSRLTPELDNWWKTEVSKEQLRSVQRMNDVLWQWRLYNVQLTSWDELLTSSSQEWSAEKQTLERVLANWQATQLTLDKATPQAARDKVIEVLRENEAVQQLFQDKTAKLVAVQSKLATSRERLDTIQKEIAALHDQSRMEFLSQDSLPLWTALFTTETNQPTSSQISESAAKLYKDGSNFLQSHKKRLLLHLALFVVLLALYLRLRYLSRQPSDVTPTIAERFVLEHSFSSALLLSLLCTPLLYFGASSQILRIGIIPVLIPILIFLPVILTPRLRIGFYFLAAIYLFDFLYAYLPPQWLLARLLLLAEAFLGMMGVGLMLWTKKVELATSATTAGGTRFLLQITMGLFAGSIVANLVGNITLAELLISPIVRIIYAAVVVCTAALVVKTFVLMALRMPLALLLRTVRQRGAEVAVSLRRFVNLAAVVLWILLSLYVLGILEVVVGELKHFMGLQWKVGEAEISVRDFAHFFLVFTTAYIVSRLLRVILSEEIFPRFTFPRGVPDALELLARYGVLLFGFLLALVSAGVNLSQVTLAISALGVGIGFGLQNIVNNFVCGLILVFEHPIQVGDFVEVGPHFGQVRRIGFRASFVHTRDGADVIIPNSELIGAKVINWSLSDQLRRVTVDVPVSLGTDAEQVIGILEKVARSHPDVIAHPAPGASLDKFGDGALHFRLHCWTHTELYFSVRTALTAAVDKAFREADIRIPVRQADVHVHWPENSEASVTSVGKST